MTKKLYIFVPIFLSVLLVISSFSNLSIYKNISDSVLRLHILANSDSIEDQKLKLNVKNQILKDTKDIFNKASNCKEAIEIANNNLSLINDISKKAIINQGYNYSVKTIVTKEYFKTRYYENFTLPAGYYNTIKIIIGQGNGHNWWCVVYPTVCISGCIDDFNGVISDEEKKFITNKKYIPKFKIIEIYNDIKNKIYS